MSWSIEKYDNDLLQGLNTCEKCILFNIFIGEVVIMKKSHQKFCKTNPLSTAPCKRKIYKTGGKSLNDILGDG